jgi:hypothetical protein
MQVPAITRIGRIAGVLLILLTVVVSAQADDQSPTPVAQEATFIEAFSQCEDSYEATGKDFGKEKTRQEMAMLDAKRSAVWKVIYGENGLAQTPEERASADSCAAEIYSEPVLGRFIAYSDPIPKRRIVINKGKGLKVVIDVRVDRCALSNWLVEHCGFIPPPPYPPTLMVIPAVAEGEYPTVILENDPMARHAETVLKGFLAERRYDYEEATMSADLQEQMDALQLASGTGSKDYGYLMAQAIGCDVYITFQYTFNDRTNAGVKTRNCSVTLSAFETTTAKGLGSETGYSEYYPPDYNQNALIEEALNNAMVGVLASINGYWKDEWKIGAKYKAIFSIICEEFEDYDAEDAGDYLVDCAKDICKKVKISVLTDKTVELLMWATQDQAEDARDLNRSIRRCFSDEFDLGRLKRRVLNRKLIFSEVICAE